LTSIFINKLRLRRGGDHDHGESNYATLYSSGIRNTNRFLYVLDESKRVIKHNTYSCLRIYRRIHFFIQQYIIRREKIQGKRHEHFKSLKTNVFESWIKENAILTKTREGCNNSFIDLYVNIFDKLKSNLRFPRVKSHLENDDYNEAKTLLCDIEKKSTDLNKKISHFMGSVKGLIVTNVFPKDILSVAAFTEYKDRNQPHGYSISLIQDHYYSEAEGYHANLIIDKDEQEGGTKYILHREDAGGNHMVISTELRALESVKEKLEGEKLKTEIIEKLKIFLNEGREICDLYNNEFIPEIRNLITQIEDEGEIKGGCGLSYCPQT
jgi:hypothetical protein